MECQTQQISDCQSQEKALKELTISLHFLIVSRLPRLSTALLALAEKLRDDNVSDKFEAFGQILTIITVFAFPPALSQAQ